MVRTGIMPAAAACLATIVVGAAAGMAQSRRQVQLSSPQLRSIGQGTSVYSFQSYSYGLGTLYSPVDYSSPLRSSIGDVNVTSLNRMNPSFSSAGTGVIVDPASSLMAYRGSLGIRPGMDQVGSGLDLRVGNEIGAPRMAPDTFAGVPLVARDPLAGSNLVKSDEDRTSIGTFLATQDDTVFGAARAYIKALEAASASLLRTSKEPLTTLVPKAEGPYRDAMANGDRALRLGSYLEAYASFEMANDINGRSPESFICLLHTQFALSRYSYAKASYFLQQALKCMPELPLADLRPRGFYGDAGKLAAQMVALEEHVERRPSDGDALLVLAYFRWFGETRDVQAARRALSAALTCALRARDMHMVEAAETFWDGVVASGKASGKLDAEPEPATRASAARGSGAPAAPKAGGGGRP